MHEINDQEIKMKRTKNVKVTLRKFNSYLQYYKINLDVCKDPKTC